MLCVPLFVPHLTSHSPPWSVLPSEWPHLHHWKLAERETKRQRGADMFRITGDTWQNRDSWQTVRRTLQSAVIKEKRGTTVGTSSPRESECVTNMCLRVCPVQITSVSTPHINTYFSLCKDSSKLPSLQTPVSFPILLHCQHWCLKCWVIWCCSHQSIWKDLQPSSHPCEPPLQSILLHVPIFFLSPQCHCTQWCFVSRQRTVLSLLPCYSTLRSPPCPMPSALRQHLLARAVSLASPIEVSALPRCQIWKEFWHDCVPLYTVWHMQMALNGPGWAKQEEREGLYTSDLQEVNQGCDWQAQPACYCSPDHSKKSEF